MTIEEVLRQKRELENHIAQELSDFCLETSLSVIGVELGLITIFGKGTVVNSVSLEVTL